MNREFRLTLCLMALCALPAAATAQGFAQPGMPDPRAGNKNDDRNDRFSPPHLHLHVPHGSPGADGPGFTPNEPPKVSPEVFVRPPFPEPPKIAPALEYPIPISRFASEVHPSPGMGRGVVGLFGAGGVGIAAFFRALFGRRKE